MSVRKPKQFSLYLDLNTERFSDQNWHYEVGEELYVVGKALMEENSEPLATYIRDGVRGVIGEIEIDYHEDDEPPVSLEKQHKVDVSVHVTKPEADVNLRQELADALIRIAADINP